MLLTLVAVATYSACAGGTFARFIRFNDLIEDQYARARWIALSALAAVLWPLTWTICAALTKITREADE